MDTHISNIGQLISPVGNGLEPRATTSVVKVSHDAQLTIRGGRIASPSTRPIARECLEIDAKGGVVMPGLIDPFWVLPSVPTWVAQSSDSSFSEGKDQLAWGQRLLAQALRNGVTTVEVKCPHDDEFLGLSTLGHLEQQHHPRVLGALLASLPEDTSERERRVSSLIGEVIPEIRHRRLATYCDIGWGKHRGVVSDATAVMRAAIGAGLRPKIHIESLSASDEVIDLALALGVASIGCASSFPFESICALAEGNVQPVYLPALYRGDAKDGFSVGTLLMEQGVPLAAGSGNGLTSSSPVSMWAVLGAAVDRMGLSLLEAIWTCTLGNAQAVELAHEVGSLEPGNRADLVLLDVADYREIPATQGTPRVSMVMVNGDVVWQG